MKNDAFVPTRIERLRQVMGEQGLSVAIVAKPENVYYFSRFNPILNSHPVFVIIPSSGDPVLLVHSLRCSHATEEGALSNVKLYGKCGDRVSVAMDPVEAIRELSSQCVKKGMAIGLELSYLSAGMHKKILAALGDPSVADLSGAIDKLKVVKDDSEISLIRKSSVLADRAMEVMIDRLRHGASEAEASTEGQYAMRMLWQQRFSEHEVSGFGSSEGGIIDALNCWCLCGSRIAYGCDCPTAYVPKPGDLVLPMVWAKLDGYHAESERTLFVGSMDSFKTNVYSTVLKARERILEMIRPDVPLADLYLAGAKIMEENGLGTLLPGRMGHGIGLSAHEFPSIQKENEMKLRPGMIFTVEPGVMSERWGGVRHSDTVLVTETGCETLTKTDRGLLEITA